MRNKIRRLTSAVGLVAAGAVLAASVGGGQTAVAGTASANVADVAASATVDTIQRSISGYAATGGTPRYWDRDALPPELWLWARVEGGKNGRVVKWRGPLLDQHGRNHNFYGACWFAIGDTSLIMCPDGYVSYS